MFNWELFSQSLVFPRLSLSLTPICFFNLVFSLSFHSVYTMAPRNTGDRCPHFNLARTYTCSSQSGPRITLLVADQRELGMLGTDNHHHCCSCIMNDMIFHIDRSSSRLGGHFKINRPGQGLFYNPASQINKLQQVLEPTEVRAASLCCGEGLTCFFWVRVDLYKKAEKASPCEHTVAIIKISLDASISFSLTVPHTVRAQTEVFS